MHRVRGAIKARALLTPHGVDPDDNLRSLETGISARGWRSTREQDLTRDRSNRPGRGRALASQAPHLQHHVIGIRPHVRASGARAGHDLVAILARALEQEGRASTDG